MLRNFKPAPNYVYRLEIDGKMVGYTNRFEHKVIITEDKTQHYFGVYATAALADEGDTCKHSAQYWVENYKLYKEAI